MRRALPLLAALFVAPSPCRALPIKAADMATMAPREAGSADGSVNGTYAQPSVAHAGDHEMALSNGQHWDHLNTGVEILSDHSGLWTPEEHQHRIRREDITHAMSEGSVRHLFIGKGVSHGGRAKLMGDAQDEVNSLIASGVSVYIGSTYDAAERYNATLRAEPQGTVAAFFHTGC